MSKYIKSLPCSGLKLVKSGSDIISEGVVNALENEAKRTVVSNWYSQSCLKLDQIMRVPNCNFHVPSFPIGPAVHYS